MARVVILSFSDNEAAEAFCKDLTRVQEQGPESGGIIPLSMLIAAYGKLEALVARPTTSCTHAFRNGTFQRTKVFGWYVHTETVGGKKCFKPAPAVVKNFIKHMIQAGGNDLLPALLAAAGDGSSSVTVDTNPTTGS